MLHLINVVRLQQQCTALLPRRPPWPSCMSETSVPPPHPKYHSPHRKAWSHQCLQQHLVAADAHCDCASDAGQSRPSNASLSLHLPSCPPCPPRSAATGLGPQILACPSLVALPPFTAPPSSPFWPFYSSKLEGQTRKLILRKFRSQLQARF